MLKNNYDIICGELNAIISAENTDYAESVNETNKILNRNSKRFDEVFRTSLDQITLTEYSFNHDFDYLSLPPMEGRSDYLILYKSLNGSAELDGFRKLGQTIYNLGFLDANIYSVEDGNIKIYDPFRLTESQDIKYDSGTTDEKVLFAINQNRGIFITLKQNGENKTYYIRELGNINKIPLSLIEPRKKIINNISSEKKSSYDKIFWSAAEFGDQYIYINLHKSKPQVKINVDKEYFYIETPSGAGIVVPRS
jgi:hypothetical protein